MAGKSIIIIGPGMGGRGWETTLPGLDSFYMVGQWATSAGVLFSNAFSGRTILKAICRQQGRKFTTP
jgi:hypothetical protein